MKRSGWTTITNLIGINDAPTAPFSAAEDVVDMVIDEEGAWRNVPGYGTVASAFAGYTKAVEGLHWFAQHGGRRWWLVFVERTSDTTHTLRYIKWPEQTLQPISGARRVPPARSFGVQFLAIDNWLYYIDGVNPPMAWNGEWESPVGFDRPAAAPAVAGNQDGYLSWDLAGANFSVAPIQPYHASQRGVGEFAGSSAPARWRRAYALTWINERGHESPPSTLVFATGYNDPLSFGSSGFVVTGATEQDKSGKKLARVSIPRAPDHVRGARLWCSRNIADVTAGSGFTLYLHSTFASGAAIDLIDGTPDEELGMELDLDLLGQFPRGARVMAMWQAQLWLAGMPDEPTRVRYSAPLTFEQFPTVNFLDLGVPEAGPVTGLRATPHGLLVFRERGIFYIKGDPRSGYVVDVITTSHGAAGPNGIVEVPRVGTAFLDRTGPYLIRGALEDEGLPSDIVFLGQGVRKLWRRRVAPDNLRLAQAHVNTALKEIWWQVPEGGDADQRLGLVYHYELDGWSRRVDWPVASWAVREGVVTFGSWDTASHPGIFVMTRGYGTKDGDDISARWDTAALRLQERAAFTGVRVWADGGGAKNLTMYHRGDRNDVWTLMSDSAIALRHQEHARPRWGTDLWSATAVFTDIEPRWVPVSFAANAIDHQFRLEAPKIRIIGFAVGLDPRLGATDIHMTENR